jgi:tetratricopeptide (TPR) repeat protein
LTSIKRSPPKRIKLHLAQDFIGLTGPGLKRAKQGFRLMLCDWSTTRRTAEKHLSRGQINAAIEEYRKLVNWDPSDLSILNTLGDLYVRVGSTEQAKLIFSRAARGFRHQGFTSKAIAIFKKLLRIDPSDLDSTVSLAQCYVTQGLRGEAGRLYEDVAEAYKRAGLEDKALDIYQRMAEIDPSNVSMLMMLGERWLRDGIRQRAHASFVTAGEELWRQKDDQQALIAFLKAQAAQPDDLKTLSAITSICAATGQADSAIPILSEALTRNPGDADLLKILGSAYLSAGRLDDAEITFQRLLALDAGAYRDLLTVGDRLLESGDLDRAVQLIDGFVDSLIINRTEHEAVDFLKKALARDPHHPSSLRRLARIFRRLREDFNLTPILNAIAEGALRRGDHDEAIEALKELCTLQPYERTHRDALERLGVQAPARPLDTSSATESDRKATTADDATQGGLLRTAADQSRDADSPESQTLDKPSWTNEAYNGTEMHLALKQIYATDNLLNSDAKNYFDTDRVSQERWLLAIGTHEFIGADDILSVPSLARHDFSMSAGADATVTDFELLPPGNRRRMTRVSARVPVVVISDSGGWREFTETVDVSDAGLTLQLAHPITPSTSLRVLIEMTKWPDRVERVRALGTTNGIVRHCLNRPGKPHLVGVELQHTQGALPFADTTCNAA